MKYYSIRDCPRGAVLSDCNNDPIIVWPDGSYARPAGQKIPAKINSISFAPYRIEELNLSAEQCNAAWHQF